MWVLPECQLLLIRYMSPSVSLGREPKRHQRPFVLSAIETAVEKKNSSFPRQLTVECKNTSKWEERMNIPGKQLVIQTSGFRAFKPNRNELFYPSFIYLSFTSPDRSPSK